MSQISMANIAVMSVQYWHYSFDYFLDSMEKYPLRNIKLWTGAPHFYYDHFSSRSEQQHNIEQLQPYESNLLTTCDDMVRMLDADGNPSGHYVWGDGNLPMQEYLQVLEKYDYQGFVTLEINDSIYWDDPHRSIERTAQYLRKVLPEI